MKHISITLRTIALLLLATIGLLWASTTARAQSGAVTLPILDCARVKEFIGYMSLSGKGLKGDFVKKNEFNENEYQVLKTITPNTYASWFENPPLVDEFGGTTHTATYAEEFYTTTTKTDAEEKCTQYIQQLKNCGYTLWEPNLNEPNRIEYSYIDYTETGNLNLYLGYQLVNQTGWVIYLDINWTVYK